MSSLSVYDLVYGWLGCIESVIGAFLEVYNTLGFGFLEHVYIMAMERELRNRGHEVAYRKVHKKDSFDLVKKRLFPN